MGVIDSRFTKWFKWTVALTGRIVLWLTIVQHKNVKSENLQLLILKRCKICCKFMTCSLLFLDLKGYKWVRFRFTFIFLFVLQNNRSQKQFKLTSFMKLFSIAQVFWLMFFSWLSLQAVFRTIIEKGKEYNEVIKIWIGPKLIVFLVDPRDIELLLSSHVYIDKSPEYRFFKPWLGNGLLISTGKYVNKAVSTSALDTWQAAAHEKQKTNWHETRWLDLHI